MYIYIYIYSRNILGRQIVSLTIVLERMRTADLECETIYVRTASLIKEGISSRKNVHVACILEKCQSLECNMCICKLFV